MPETRTCPRCGAGMNAENAGGLCPRCLIGLNLSSPTEAPTGFEDDNPESGFKPKLAVAPSLAEMAAYFSELDILELLGQGGMGAVYMARQRRLNRLVALKILPPTVVKDPSFAERFTREAQALARLNHPNIVTLYEFGQKDGLFYFLMEYVDGVNLRQLLNASRLTSKEALAIVPQICDALQYAHEKGIVHRDIKPENLLLNKQGQVKIADFGVAKLVAEGLEKSGNGDVAPGPEAGLTKTGGTLGTPQYMAPEQVSRPLEVDHRADIYSLGVVFYQMLTGELPTGKFAPPSNKVVIDVRLDQVVLRALERQPELRYQHVSEVRTELETIQRTAGQESSTSEPPAPTSPALQRRTAPFSRPGLIAIGVLGMLGFFWWLNYAGWLSHGKFHSARTLRFRAGEGWQQRATAEVLNGRSSSTAVWTGEEMIVFGGEGLNVTFGDGARYNPRQDSWATLVLQGAAPSSRTCSSAIWTGSAMIVWGGFGGSDAEDVNRNDGARFNPASNVWRRVTTQGAPNARFDHSALWTGQEMLIWGGFGGSRTQLYEREGDEYMGTGGRYDPATDTWRDITTNGAPSKRLHPAAVWTGREMIIWGGGNSTGDLNDGARYDPVADTWKPMRSESAPSHRSAPLAVWTGKDMIVWGGYSTGTKTNVSYLQDGARYDPETDAWTPVNTLGAPKPRVITQAVWTGKELVVWGGVNDTAANGVKDPNRYVGTGSRYNPVTDKWAEISTQDAPSPRAGSATVWTGTGLLLFGGYNGKHLNDTYYYSPTQ